MLKHYHLKGNYRLEKQFQTDYLKALRNDGYITYKIADVGLGYKFLDSFCIDKDGVVTFIEFKIVDGVTFNISHYESSQGVLLKDLDKRKIGLAYTAIWSKKQNDYVLLSFTDIISGMNERGGYKIFKS